jgi:hypothetical protein
MGQDGGAISAGAVGDHPVQRLPDDRYLCLRQIQFLEHHPGDRIAVHQPVP